MNIKNRIGKYELGRILGEGNFAKVKLAINVETGQSYAVKILDKKKVFEYKIVTHILASKKKIYIVLEFVTGGELLDKIIQARNGKLHENLARKYFQQLIDAVGYCHSRGVYHRDLKVIANRGYDGATADLWSCGVILFVLLTGWLPFDDRNIVVLYQKIFKSDFKCPNWLSPGARNLIRRILDPNPKTRITIPDIIENEWFKKGYSPAKHMEEDTSLVDVNVAFTNAEEHLLTEETGPVHMNAFQLIAMSVSLDLSGFFEEEEVAERKTSFMSMFPAKDIIQKIEETVRDMGFQGEKKNGKLMLRKTNAKSSRNGHLSVATVARVFEEF